MVISPSTELQANKKIFFMVLYALRYFGGFRKNFIVFAFVYC